jgi:hypothetical protein
LEGHTLLTGRLPDAPEGLAVAPGDPLADTLTVALPDALWLGKVSDARDHLYVDLWPFPDVTFDGGSASLSVSTGGCSGGGDAALPDADLDGIPDLDDDDDDNDGIFDDADDDDDNDGVLDGDDPQTPGTPSGDGGSGDDGGSGGCGGSSTDSGSGSTGGGGCDGGSSSSGGGDGCDGGSSGPSCSGGVDCGGITCAASPLLPIAWLTFVFSAVRRRGPRPG